MALRILQSRWRRWCIGLELERNQWNSPEFLGELRWRRMKALLKYAYDNVPFYRKQWQHHGLDPRDVRNLDDFTKIPLVTRVDIQTHVHQMIATNYLTADLIRDATGGSTGNPITFFRDQRANLVIQRAAWRFRKWIGYKPGDKLALIWGMDRDAPATCPGNERWLDSFNFTPEQIRHFVDEMLIWRPDAIRGYASSLYFVAAWIKSVRGKSPRPRGIESSAEKIWPEQRQVIEDVFGCKVFDMYGSREIPSIACECEYHQGLHVFSDIRYVEIVRRGLQVMPDEEGSVVVTDLVNYAMPLIRYEMGDVGIMSKSVCACGRGFPLLKEVKGRLTSTIVTPSGRHIHGEFFTHLFYNVPGVKAFQVRQRRIDSVDVAVEKDASFDPALMEQKIAQMKAHLGSQVTVNWNVVRTIPLAPSGKRHFTISDVPVRFAP